MNNQGGQRGSGADAKQKERARTEPQTGGPIAKKKSWEEIDQGWGDEPESGEDAGFKDTVAENDDDSRTDTIPGFHDVPAVDTLKGTGRTDTIPEDLGSATEELLVPDEQVTQVERAAPSMSRTEAKTVMGIGPRDLPEQAAPAAPPPPAARAPELGEADTMPISALSTEQARLPAPPAQKAPAPAQPAPMAAPRPVQAAPAPAQPAPMAAPRPVQAAPAPGPPEQRAPAPTPQKAVAPPPAGPAALPTPLQPPAQGSPAGPSNLPLIIVWVLALASVGVAAALWVSR